MYEVQFQNEVARLPTRVGRACERCRRNKSRCDTYRPCSLCLRANVQCIASTSDARSPIAQRRTVASARPIPHSEAADAGLRHKRARQETQSSPPGEDASLRYSTSSRQESGSITQTPPPRSPREHLEPAHEDSGDGESAITIARKIHRMESQQIDDRAINAIPGADIGHRLRALGSLSHASRASTASYLMHALPDDEIMVQLIEEYFESVHWFSLVILESKFRIAFNAVRGGSASPSERPFLLLLSTILGLAAWYRGNGSRSSDGRPAEFWQDWSKKLIANSESQIIEIMNQNSITAIQVLILLGSFYVYHGRPNLSFSLLGATVKAAQAMGLHRETAQASLPDREEKKRVWWTIYTWDRFASITYGRPLGISDKDCNVSQPQDVLENPRFSPSEPVNRNDLICYSTYQRELNKLYLIASPAIKNIYSAQASDSHAALENLARVRDVTVQLWKWRQRLPQRLLPRQDNDCSGDLTAGSRAHVLQSLSLQLTFDSLIIVLHRPFINHRFDLVHTDGIRRRSNETTNLEQQETSPIASSEASLALDTSSHQQWWEAAVRTSQVTEMPQLTQFATDSHLVAFLAINLFNAAMVMVAVALSDPLMNSAQEAKRAVARIYRLQETLGSRSTLSEQSSRVLRSLVQLLLRRESDAILAPVAREGHGRVGDQSSKAGEHDTGRMTVRDALSISIQPKAGADSVSRFNDGIVSVQKAFTYVPGVEFAANSLPYSEQEDREIQPRAESTDSIRFNSGAADLFDTDLTTVDWNSGNAVDDSGLYWIWDSAWDDLYNDMNLAGL